MTKYLLRRPIAVGMSFVALLVFSVLAYFQLPISLLPDIDVPQLAIRVEYPNTSATAIEQNVLSPLRRSMATMSGLERMRSTASNQSGMLELNFVYGNRMDLAYVEANEKVDRLMDQFPKDMDRPQVIRLNTADIPMLRLHINPKEATDLSSISLLTENVLKKRLEQLEGISLVDRNGVVEQEIRLIPKQQLLENYGLNQQSLMQAIQAANQALGGIEVKDGQYQYFMRMSSELEDMEAIQSLPIVIGEGANKRFIPLATVADISLELKPQQGLHTYDQQPGIVLNLHKQHEADMTDLMPKVHELVRVFEADYPALAFHITQDQSTFLEAGINNLLGSLFFGGLFAFAVLFLFMGSVRLPFIMGISLPSSLIISFLLFHAFGLSINIISLSGLALGLGMLIDNAIIVLENINRKRAEGLELVEACHQGVAEVRGALISSVLTTLAVFIPLIFLSGITGVLFYDQAVSVAIILVVSLMVSFLLLPLLYKLFFKQKAEKAQQDSRFFGWLLKGFEALHHRVFEKPILFMVLLLLLLPLAWWMGSKLEVRGMPVISRTDLQMQINWQEPIGLEENQARTEALVQAFDELIAETEADIGLSDYLLQNANSALQQTKLYINFKTLEERAEFERHITGYFDQGFPLASYELEEAPNAFDLLFKRDQAALTLKWRAQENEQLEAQLALLDRLEMDDYELGASLRKEEAVVVKIDQALLRRYNIAPELFMQELAAILRPSEVTKIGSFSQEIPVVWVSGQQKDFKELIQLAKVENREGESFQLSKFVTLSYEEQFKELLADGSGPYFHINFNDVKDPASKLDSLRAFLVREQVVGEVGGSYFADRKQLQEIIYVLLISILLLYFILAAQFESFWQPLLVLFSLPFGIGGALLFLWLGGGSLNVMSGIGMVVMLGIMVNDAILKIDTMNRLGQQADKQAHLYEAVLEAGMLRLKPILMTSITTLLALSPVLVLGGLGAELQKPLVLSVMGGLTIGTGTALYFVPLLYYGIKKKSGLK